MEIALNAISGKWKPAIISALLKGQMRPKDLAESLPEATKRVITQQLRELENDNIIDKIVFDEIPLRVEYFLTPLGKSLLPVVNALSVWGNEFQKSKKS